MRWLRYQYDKWRCKRAVQSDSFSAFCIKVRASGTAGSKRLGIKDPVLALDFDHAVTLRIFEMSAIFADINCSVTLRGCATAGDAFGAIISQSIERMTETGKELEKTIEELKNPPRKMIRNLGF